MGVSGKGEPERRGGGGRRGGIGSMVGRTSRRGSILVEGVVGGELSSLRQ